MSVVIRKLWKAQSLPYLLSNPRLHGAGRRRPLPRHWREPRWPAPVSGQGREGWGREAGRGGTEGRAPVPTSLPSPCQWIGVLGAVRIPSTPGRADSQPRGDSSWTGTAYSPAVKVSAPQAPWGHPSCPSCTLREM